MFYTAFLSFKRTLGLVFLTVLVTSQVHAMDVTSASPKKIVINMSSLLTSILIDRQVQSGQVQVFTPEYIKERIAQANAGNIEAQDEAVNLDYEGKSRELLEPEMFAAWKNIQDRCDKDDKYASFVVLQKNYKKIGKRFPNLRTSIEARANQGHGVALYNLSYIHKYGLWGMIKNEKEANALLQRAADAGVAPAQVDIAFWYLSMDTPKATLYFGKAATQDYPLAYYNLGVLYREILHNDEKAVFYWRLAANHGYVAAQTGLAIMYENGLGGLAKDEEQAVLLYQLPADQGDDVAQNNLGVMHDNGRGGLKKDKEEAIRLFKLSAARGNEDAQKNLAVKYHYGYGLKKDMKEAIRLYTLAAKKGNKKAQEKLQLIYQEILNKLGQDEGMEEAIYLLTLLVDHGYGGAQKKRDEIYQTCISNLQKDKTKAIRLLTLLADHGHTEAQKKLGLMYAEGCGVEKNYHEALRWLFKSKHPEVKSVVYSILGTPTSFGEQKYSFGDKENHEGSFQDMLDRILSGERLDDSAFQVKLDKFKTLLQKGQQAGTANPYQDPLMGLGSLVYTHQTKKENTKLYEKTLAERLCPLYTTVEAVESELLALITSMKESNVPGFMIPGFKKADEKVLQELRKPLKAEDREPIFAAYSLKVMTNDFFWPVLSYYSFRAPNVALTEKFVQCLNTLDTRWSEADKALEAIAHIYQEEYGALKPEQKEFDDLPDVLSAGKSKKASWMKGAKNDTDKERCSLENIKNKFKALPYFGQSTRAWEFFQENSWLK